MTPSTRDRFVTSSHEQWRALVNFSFLCPPDKLEEEINLLAKRVTTTSAGIRRKVEAIRYSKNVAGLSQDDIIKAGQSATLSKFGTRNGNKAKEKQRFIRWKVSISLADAIKPKDSHTIEEVESLQSRFIRVLKIRTSDEFWDFINSDYADISDEELKNRGGMGSRFDKFRKRA
jgi:hypothetical protein